MLNQVHPRNWLRQLRDAFGSKESSNELTRRQFLELATIGAGLATFGLGLSSANAFTSPTQEGCPRVISLFWSVVGARIGGFRCEPCFCLEEQNFLITYSLRGLIQRVGTPCDETPNFVPEGSLFTATLNQVLRRTGPHGRPVGRHEGRFELFNPAGDLLANGTMQGMDGVDPRAELICAEFPLQFGTMQGTGAPRTSLQDCTIWAMYLGLLGVEVPCFEPYTSWDARIPGVIECRCRR
ncbi:MAG: twin-arginine translocation signal domain-containing protein [Acidobacteria bacterium]|nr:twin-arginine translocation signal domain-containing protein [Acidobacteriota bacterium]